MNIKVGFLPLLFLLFLVLKLAGIITWSWWWVTAPLWLGLLIWLAICGTIVTFLWKWGR